MTRKLFALLVAALISLGVAAPADAAPVPTASAVRAPPRSSGGKAPARASRVSVQILVVHATNSHKRVDSRLQNVKRYLSHLNYTGYELLDSHGVQLSGKGSQTIQIPGGRKVIIEILSKDDDRVRMRMQVISSKGQKFVDTTFSVNRGGSFMVAGPRYKDGILVLPVTVRY